MLEKEMATHSSALAWKIPWMEEPGRLQPMGSLKSQARLRDFTFTFHFHALEKEMATHSSVLAWRIPGTGEPGGLPSMGSHRVRHDWSDLAAAAAADRRCLKSQVWARGAGRVSAAALVAGGWGQPWPRRGTRYGTRTPGLLSRSLPMFRTCLPEASRNVEIVVFQLKLFMNQDPSSILWVRVLWSRPPLELLPGPPTTWLPSQSNCLGDLPTVGVMFITQLILLLASPTAFLD